MPTARVPIEFTWGTSSGSPGVNVWHMRVDENNVEGNVDSLLSALDTFYTTITPAMAPGWVATLGDIVLEETRESVNPTYSWSVPTAGATTAAPSALAVVIGWKTSLKARRGMGRTFIGPFGKGAMDDTGTPDAGTLTLLEDAADAIITANQAVGNGAFAVYGYSSALAPGTSRNLDSPRVARDITGYAIKDKFAVLRSRRD